MSGSRPPSPSPNSPPTNTTHSPDSTTSRAYRLADPASNILIEEQRQESQIPVSSPPAASEQPYSTTPTVLPTTARSWLPVVPVKIPSLPMDSNLRVRSFASNIFARTSLHLKAILLTGAHYLVLFATFGTAYFQYRLYGYQGRDSSGTIGTIIRNPTNLWLENVGHMKWCWKTYSYMSVGTLPLIFPMLSVAGLPVCSVTRMIAALALLSGVVNLVMSALYRGNIRTLEREYTTYMWVEASSENWSLSINKKFWVFLCLPMLWFFIYFTLLTASIASPFWEIVTIVERQHGAGQGACFSAQLKFIGYGISLALSVSLAHLVFAVFMFWSLNCRSVEQSRV
ncbi:hypothetical protein D9756_011107 [Leucocoprinus leucothites]|uniref:Uncharacterized protein n=1 Tax=Leucocoprinus leucothites TaxID=201217 RepID=A0A8H5CT59_9AGAR|nr:hypothetical protein D9756_011107 [Leucoagaricus leucothites]